MTSIAIHPAVDSGFRATDAAFAGGTLVCKCASNPVKVKIKGDIAHNHACGCTKCWKPEGAVFSVVAVAPTESVAVEPYQISCDAGCAVIVGMQTLMVTVRDWVVQPLFVNSPQYCVVTVG